MPSLLMKQQLAIWEIWIPLPAAITVYPNLIITHILCRELKVPMLAAVVLPNLFAKLNLFSHFLHADQLHLRLETE